VTTHLVVNRPKNANVDYNSSRDVSVLPHMTVLLSLQCPDDSSKAYYCWSAIGG
jgi:hypothetical protein